MVIFNLGATGPHTTFAWRIISYLSSALTVVNISEIFSRAGRQRDGDKFFRVCCWLWRSSSSLNEHEKREIKRGHRKGHMNTYKQIRGLFPACILGEKFIHLPRLCDNFFIPTLRLGLLKEVFTILITMTLNSWRTARLEWDLAAAKRLTIEISSCG